MAASLIIQKRSRDGASRWGTGYVKIYALDRTALISLFDVQSNKHLPFYETSCSGLVDVLHSFAGSSEEILSSSKSALSEESSVSYKPQELYSPSPLPECISSMQQLRLSWSMKCL